LRRYQSPQIKLQNLDDRFLMSKDKQRDRAIEPYI